MGPLGQSQKENRKVCTALGVEKGGIPDLVPKIKRYDHYVIKYNAIVTSISTQECKEYEFLFVTAFSNPIPVERKGDLGQFNPAYTTAFSVGLGLRTQGMETAGGHLWKWAAWHCLSCEGDLK